MRYSKLILICNLLLLTLLPVTAQETTVTVDPSTIELNLTVEKGITTARNKTGDLLVARLQDNIYREGNNIIPKGSWVIGHVSSLKSPTRFSRRGQLIINLDHIITAWGDVFPLNTRLSFDSQNSQVQIQTPQEKQTFSDQALKPTKKLLNSKIGKVFSVATLGLPVVATSITGGITAVAKEGKNIGFDEGETFKLFYTFE